MNWDLCRTQHMPDLSWALRWYKPMGWGRAGLDPRVKGNGRIHSPPAPPRTQGPALRTPKSTITHMSRVRPHRTSWPPLPLTTWSLHPWAVPTFPCSPPLLCPRHAASPTSCTGGPAARARHGGELGFAARDAGRMDWGRQAPAVPAQNQPI